MIWMILGSIIIICIYFVIPPYLIQLNEDWGLPIWQNANGKTIGKYFVGIGITLWMLVICILCTVGEGTPFLDAPTTKLVNYGPYRYSRNPLYVCYMLILFGIYLYKGHLLLFFYVLFIFILFNLFIILVEEPGLRHRFGVKYEHYLRTVPRWLPIWPRSSKGPNDIPL